MLSCPCSGDLDVKEQVAAATGSAPPAVTVLCPCVEGVERQEACCCGCPSCGARGAPQGPVRCWGPGPPVPRTAGRSVPPGRTQAPLRFWSVPQFRDQHSQTLRTRGSTGPLYPGDGSRGHQAVGSRGHVLLPPCKQPIPTAQPCGCSCTRRPPWLLLNMRRGRGLLAQPRLLLTG